MLNKISLMGSKPDNGFVTFTPRTFYADELCGWNSTFDWSSEYIDRIPYWYVGGEKVSLKEVSVGTLSKLSQNNIELNGVINFDLTVACLGYSVERVIKSGNRYYFDGLFDDPWELMKYGKKTLMFTPPQTAIYRKNKESPTLCKEGRINVFQECDGFSTIIHNWGSRVKQIVCGIWAKRSCVSVSRIGTYCNNSGIQHSNSDRNSGGSVDSYRQPESEGGKPDWRIFHFSRRSIVRRNDGANGTRGRNGRLWFGRGGSYRHKGSCVADIFNDLMNLLGASPRMEVCHAE